MDIENRKNFGFVLGLLEVASVEGEHRASFPVVRSCLEITLPDIMIYEDGFRSSILHGIDLCGD